MRAETPAPSALRRTAPTLPGFSTPSSTATSGSAGSAISSSVRCGISATPSTPSARRPNASFSNTGPLTARISPPQPDRTDKSRCASGTLAEFFANEHFHDPRAGGDRPGQFPHAVDEDAPLPLAMLSIAEADGVLHPRILPAVDDGHASPRRLDALTMTLSRHRPKVGRERGT